MIATHGLPIPSSAVASTMNGQLRDPLSTISRRKRKADGFDQNERLQKRMSLLNLEQSGSKLYVPVESPHVASTAPAGTQSSLSSNSTLPVPAAAAPSQDDSMQLDNSKHKVYIYNLDDELSSESEAEDGKLVFLPDIDRHLRSQRKHPGADNIPSYIRPNEDGELAGMQMVLYSDPASLTVPKEQDSVRKVILEARARVREKQKEEEALRNGLQITPPASMTSPWQSVPEADPDAMEID
jgi:hypothetical protein